MNFDKESKSEKTNWGAGRGSEVGEWGGGGGGGGGSRGVVGLCVETKTVCQTVK